MSLFKKNTLSFFCVASLVVFLLSCAKEEPADVAGAGYNDDGALGVVDDAAGFFVKALNPSNTVQYFTHKDASDFTTPCVAQPGEDIICHVEAEELDLYYRGISFKYNVPSTMCAYFRQYYYFYSFASSGAGPAAIQVDTDSSGNVGVDNDNDGTVDAAVETCDYIHDDVNCCTGTYTKSVRTWDANLGSYVAEPAQTGVAWGGKAANCLDGPGIALHTKISGWPIADLSNVDGKGINAKVTIQAPVTGTRSSNVYAANYFKASEHASGTPAAAQNPYYEFECLDEARETISRIRILVREWNRKEDFDNRTLDATAHDTTGFENPPFNTKVINDYNDWKDYADTYPGI